MAITLNGTSGETFPTWTTATRPASPVQGQTGYNTTINSLEAYNGTTWTMVGMFGPAFGAYQSVAQTALAAATPTKIIFQQKEFDTNTNFDNTTNYRFTPTVAGYYQINAAVQVAGSSSSLYAMIYKNGSQLKIGSLVAAVGGSPISFVGAIINFNGTTDYVEIYATTGSSLATQPGQPVTYFNGAMVRSA